MNDTPKNKRPYRPPLACRISQEIHDMITDLAERRLETVSDVVETAIKEYMDKVKALEESYNNNGRNT